MKRKTGIKIISIIFAITAIVFFAALSIFNNVYIKSTVSGSSMCPTLHSSDRIFINSYNKGNINDIVVADIEHEENWVNKEDGHYVVKRLIATAGDKVKIVHSGDFKYDLYINDTFIESKQLTTGSNSYFGFMAYIQDNKDNTERVEDGAIKVLENEIFIVGDNWEVSYDSFSCGPLSKDCLIGKVDIIVAKNNNLFWGAIKGLFKLWF